MTNWIAESDSLINDKAFQALWRECEKELCRVAIKRHMVKLLSEGQNVGAISQVCLGKLGKSAFKKGSDASAQGFTLVTIGAKEGIDPKSFINLVPKVWQKKGLETEGSVSYSLEQRSEGDQDPYGWHIHVLCKWRDKAPKSARSRLIYQGFAKYLAGQNYVDLRQCTGNTEGQVLAYISGLKKEESKAGKVEKDRKLRAELGLQDLYEIIFPGMS